MPFVDHRRHEVTKTVVQEHTLRGIAETRLNDLRPVLHALIVVDVVGYTRPRQFNNPRLKCRD